MVVPYRDGSGTDRTEHADAAIITTKFTHAVELHPPLKEPGGDLLYATEYTGCYSLQVMYERRTTKEPFIVLVPKSASEEVAAVFLEHVKAPDRAPAGKSQITVFFNPSDSDTRPDAGGDFSTRSDEALTKTARDFVEAVFAELVGHFLGSHLTRWDYAAHKGKVGYYRALDTFLREHPSSRLDTGRLIQRWSCRRPPVASRAGRAAGRSRRTRPRR